jgi:uncharacterized protein (TIRG00374 family)
MLAKPVRGKLLRVGLRLLGPLLLLVVLWRMDHKEALWDALLGANGLLLLGAATLNAGNIHLKVLRWRVLLDARGFSFSNRQAWKAILPSMYIGMLTPGRVGDVLRVQYTRHEANVPYAEGLAVVVMDRFCDLYVLLAFVAAGVAHFASVLAGDLGKLTWIGVILTALAPLLFLIRGPADKLFEGIYARVAKEKSPDGARQFLLALRAQLGRRLLYTVPLSVGAFLLQYIQGFIAARALGMNIGFVDVMFMLAIASLLSLLPISMSGVGISELFLALAFPAIGLTAEQGVAFGLVMFVVIYVATMSAGFVAWQVAPPPIESRPPTDANRPAEGSS